MSGRRRVRSPRGLVAVAILVLAGLAGLAACSGDDDGGFPGDVDGEAGEQDAAPGEGVCGLVSTAELEELTGVRFRAGTPAPGTCSYQGEEGGTTLTVNVTDLPADAALALETTSSTCDADSATDLEVPGASGAFACTVSGVAVAAGTSEHAYAVVMGAALGDPAAPSSAFPALGAVLEAVLAEGGAPDRS